MLNSGLSDIALKFSIFRLCIVFSCSIIFFVVEDTWCQMGGRSFPGYYISGPLVPGLRRRPIWLACPHKHALLSSEGFFGTPLTLELLKHSKIQNFGNYFFLETFILPKNSVFGFLLIFVHIFSGRRKIVSLCSTCPVPRSGDDKVIHIPK